MLIKEYAVSVKSTDVFSAEGRAIAVRRYGLFGQVGALLGLIKKMSREAQLIQQRAARLEELGDIAWYTFALIDEAQLNALDIVRGAVVELGLESTVPIESFESLDEACGGASIKVSEDELLHALAARAGELLAELPSDHCDSAPLIRFLAALLRVSLYWSLPLQEAVRLNVEKTKGRWPGPNPKYGDRLDAGAKEFEQFPNELTFCFVQRESFGSIYVYPQVFGLNIGDRLTDNRHEPDGYRFHDIFHIAYAVHLGWSPVLRGLLKLKRKHEPAIDENEDGARAMIIEEGIATWIFNHAGRDGNEYYNGVKRGQLPYRLLKQVKEMTRGYEVYERPLWQWDEAILDGFQVFRQLCASKGGAVTANFYEHRMTFAPLTEASS